MQPQSWADRQEMFAAALVSPDAALPMGLVAGRGGDASERFAIYRNNVIVGLVDALQAAFPVTAQLVGDEFFRAMARVHVTRQLPATAVLADYGTGLPALIESFTPAASLPWLADVARLELAWSRAYGAADAEPLTPRQLLGIAPDQLLQARFALHPATHLLCSEHPVAALWLAHQEAEVVRPPVNWVAECVLITRPVADVRVQPITAGEYEFLLALQGGENVETASIAALEAAAGFAPGAALSTALNAGAFSDFA
ncbi:MAG: DNA-binding domain-containing protein [Pseudomonadota bacterium]